MPMYLPKLHECAELPTQNNIVTDGDCLSRIRGVFHIKRWLGDGEYGIVLLLETVIDGIPQDLVVKISLADSAENELRIACQLNELNQETPIFPHTYGWLVCAFIPREWLAILSDQERKHDILVAHHGPYMFMFVQPVRDKWTEIPLVIEHRYRTSLFFLLHGLWVAQSRLGFDHGDIHEQNLMMQSNEKSEMRTTTLRYGEMEAELTCIYIPRLIDYGQSYTVQHPTYRPEGDDIRSLLEDFYSRLERDANAYSSAKIEFEAYQSFAQSNEYQNLGHGPDTILALLAHSYFDIPQIQQLRVQRRRIDPDPIQQRCFVCCTPNVGYMITHHKARPKYFCGHSCYAKVDAILPFIK